MDQDVNSRLTYWSRQVDGIKTGNVRIIIPLLILWNIWTSRNNAIHRGEVFKAEVVTNRVVMYLQWATSAKKLTRSLWAGCTPQVTFTFPQERRRSNPRLITVRWEAPERGWIKVNTDGAFNPNTGQAGGGGIIRDHTGMILEGFHVGIQATSGMEAEIEAISIGIDTAIKLGGNIWIETDAQDVISKLENRGKGPASLRHKLSAIRIKIKRHKCRISHIFREGNKVADWLSKQGRTSSEIHTFDQVSAPQPVKELVCLDQTGIPYVRVFVDDDMG